MLTCDFVRHFQGVGSLFKGAGANILRGVAGAGVLSMYDKLQELLFGKVRLPSPSALLPLRTVLTHTPVTRRSTPEDPVKQPKPQLLLFPTLVRIRSISETQRLFIAPPNIKSYSLPQKGVCAFFPFHASSGCEDANASYLG